jgi:hypothetical protein
LFEVVSQTGFVVVLQSLLPTHSTHWPEGEHAGVAALSAAHSGPLVQARQAFEVMSQIGFVATPQSDDLPHSAHAPDARHTGLAVLTAMHSAPEPQARH